MLGKLLGVYCFQCLPYRSANSKQIQAIDSRVRKEQEYKTEQLIMSFRKTWLNLGWNEVLCCHNLSPLPLSSKVLISVPWPLGVSNSPHFSRECSLRSSWWVQVLWFVLDAVSTLMPSLTSNRRGKKSIHKVSLKTIRVVSNIIRAVGAVSSWSALWWAVLQLVKIKQRFLVEQVLLSARGFFVCCCAHISSHQSQKTASGMSLNIIITSLVTTNTAAE